MTPQIAAGSIAEPQFLNELWVTEASLPQILSRFWMMMKLSLVKGSRSVEQLGLDGHREVLLQVGDGFTEGEMLEKLHKANQVTAALTAVAVEQILPGIDIERRPGFPVQRAESHELLSRADAVRDPVALL